MSPCIEVPGWCAGMSIRARGQHCWNLHAGARRIVSVETFIEQLYDAFSPLGHVAAIIGPRGDVSGFFVPAAELADGILALAHFTGWQHSEILDLETGDFVS